MKLVTAIIKPFKLDDVREALDGVAAGQIVSLHFSNPLDEQVRVVNVRMPS